MEDRNNVPVTATKKSCLKYQNYDGKIEHNCKKQTERRMSKYTQISDETLSIKNDVLRSQIFDAEPILPTPYIRWGYRHQQCLTLFCVFTVAYSMRSYMGVALVAMTKHEKTDNMTELIDGNTTKHLVQDGIMNVLMLVPPYPAFHWSKKVQNTVLASFYWGYTATQIPAGQLAHRFGAKYMLIGAMLSNGVASIVLPTATYYGGWYCTIVCRFVQGLSQACIVPGIQTFLGKWVPIHERGRLAAFVYGGQSMGTTMGLPLTGFISASPMGWPGIFRVYGILSVMMALVIIIVLSESPAKHEKISSIEKKYIEDDVGTIEARKKMRVPWKQIFTHTGFWATLTANIACSWGHLVFYAEVPHYLDKIMGVDIKANGLLSALPFVMMWFAGLFFYWFTDWIIVNKYLTVTNTRKLANFIGSFPPAIALVVLAYAPNNIYVVEAILIVACMFKIAALCSFTVNQIDISPNFAGTMISLTGFSANIGASIAPIIFGFILSDVRDPYLWRHVFFLTAGIYVVTNLIYLKFATSERAKWNDLPTEPSNDAEEAPMLNKNKEKINL